MIANQINSSPSPLPRSVRRALDAMHANVGHNWSVAELAAVASISGRTLQRQFLSFLGKTPRAVLRDIGFERRGVSCCRARLGARVTDVALRCGFPHCGRFSVEYRRRYGETPSQTLKRQAVFADVLASMPSFIVSPRDRPTVAFGAIEAAAENLEIAGSIADDLATALTRAGIAVTSRPMSARYHLLGAIRGEGAQMRLIFRLIDNETGRQLWAHRSEGVLGDDAAADEHLATRIAAALQPCLRLAEIDHARKRRTPISARTNSRCGPCRAFCRSTPREIRARSNCWSVRWSATPTTRWRPRSPRGPTDSASSIISPTNPDADRARSAELARKAQTLAGDATVFAALGTALTFLHDLDAADLMIRKALSVDGGSAWAWSRSGWLDVYKGDAELAIERFKIALDLAPQDGLAFNSLVGIGCAHFKVGNYAEAASWQERALVEHPSATWIHRTMCPAYVLIGAESEARRSVTALRENYPELTIAEVQRGMPPLPQTYCDLVVDALHDVGLPL